MLRTLWGNRKPAEGILRWINRTYDTEETNQDYQVAVKVFGRQTSDENGSDQPGSLD